MKRLTVRGTLRVPGDKSISHRALILAALSRGKSRIRYILESEDVQATADSLRRLGAAIPPITQDFYVTSRSLRDLRSTERDLDCRNSGTTARLLAGVAAGAGLRARFVGDASLSRRPMRRVAEPLRMMGAHVDLSASGGLPMTVNAGPLHDIDWYSPVASAQVKSAVLFAALVGGTRASVAEPHQSRDHTERMLLGRGVQLALDGTTVEIPAGQIVRPDDVNVPADPSSAAFFVALGLLSDRSDIELADVCLNPTRTGFLAALARMNGKVDVANRRQEAGETLGTLQPRASSLRGIEVAAAEVPSMIDELPLLACTAARAEGETIVRGAAELRVKESDRIKTVVENLNRIGGDAEELPDGFRVRGSRAALKGRVETLGDHRIAMAFGVLGALPGNDITIDDRDCVSVSYPGFWADLDRVQG